MASLTRQGSVASSSSTTDKKLCFVYGAESLALLCGRLNNNMSLTKNVTEKTLSPRCAKISGGCWRRVFAGNSSDWKGGVATLVHTRSVTNRKDGDNTRDSVPGILFELTASQLLVMDDFYGGDGRSPKCSREHIVIDAFSPVGGFTKTIAQAWVMDDPSYTAPPSPQYLLSMGELLRDHVRLLGKSGSMANAKIEIVDSNFKKRADPHICSAIKQRPQSLEEVAVLINSAMQPKWKMPEEIPRFVQKVTAIGISDVQGLRALLETQCDSQVISLLRHASQAALSLNALAALRLAVAEE